MKVLSGWIKNESADSKKELQTHKETSSSIKLNWGLCKLVELEKFFIIRNKMEFVCLEITRYKVTIIYYSSFHFLHIYL